VGDDSRKCDANEVGWIATFVAFDERWQATRVVEEMVTEIVEAKQFALLRYAQMFSSLVFKDKDDRAWLERRFAVYKDILEESWVYQETKEKGREEGRQQERQRQRRSIETIVQTKFPEMLDLTKKQIENVSDPEVLQDLIVKISLAQTLSEALLALGSLSNKDKIR